MKLDKMIKEWYNETCKMVSKPKNACLLILRKLPWGGKHQGYFRVFSCFADLKKETRYQTDTQNNFFCHFAFLTNHKLIQLARQTLIGGVYLPICRFHLTCQRTMKAYCSIVCAALMMLLGAFFSANTAVMAVAPAAPTLVEGITFNLTSDTNTVPAGWQVMLFDSSASATLQEVKIVDIATQSAANQEVTLDLGEASNYTVNHLYRLKLREQYVLAESVGDDGNPAYWGEWQVIELSGVDFEFCSQGTGGNLYLAQNGSCDITLPAVPAITIVNGTSTGSGSAEIWQVSPDVSLLSSDQPNGFYGFSNVNYIKTVWLFDTTTTPDDNQCLTALNDTSLTADNATQSVVSVYTNDLNEEPFETSVFGLARNGTHTLCSVSVDNADYTSAAFKQTFTLDTDLPTVESETVPAEGTSTLPGLENGMYLDKVAVEVEATDNNSSGLSKIYTLQKAASEVGDGTSCTQGSYAQGTYDVTTDPAATATSVSGTTASVNTQISYGNHCIYFAAVDNAGYKSETYSRLIKVSSFNSPDFNKTDNNLPGQDYRQLFVFDCSTSQVSSCTATNTVTGHLNPLDSTEAYEVCLSINDTTINKCQTVGPGTYDYSFLLTASDFPASQDVFVGGTITVTEPSGNKHAFQVWQTYLVKRRVPAIVKTTQQNSYILMRNGRFN